MTGTDSIGQTLCLLEHYLVSCQVFINFYPNVTTLRSGLCSHRSVCLSSVTLVHPTQGIEAFGSISLLLCTLAIH